MPPTTTTNDRDARAQLLADGWQPGPPWHLTVEALVDDLDSYRDLACEACGHEEQQVDPYHRGRQYLLVCTCRACGHSQEV